MSLLFEMLRTLSLVKFPRDRGKEPVMPLFASDSTSKERHFESWGRLVGKNETVPGDLCCLLRVTLYGGKGHYAMHHLAAGSRLRENNVAVGHTHTVLAD